MDDRLMDCIIDRLLDRLIDWLVGWSLDCLINLFNASLVFAAFPQMAPQRTVTVYVTEDGLKAAVNADFEEDGIDDGASELDPNKQLFLRRQPRRFAHTKSFSNGVADRATVLIPFLILCAVQVFFRDLALWKLGLPVFLGWLVEGAFPDETRKPRTQGLPLWPVRGVLPDHRTQADE